MKLKISHLNFLLLLFIPITLIDTVNGYFALSGVSVPASTLYKALIVGCAVIFAFMNPAVSVLLGYVLTISIYQSLQYTQSFMYDFSSLLKSFLLPLMICVFFHLKSKLDDKSLKYIEWIFVTTFIIISVNVILGIVGIGYTTYGSYPISSGFGHGFKGFIFAGNELGGLLVVTYPIVINFVYVNFNKFRFIINILYAIVAVLIGTKTAMLGIIILIMYNSFTFSKNYITKLFFPSLFIVVIFYFVIFNMDLFQIYLDRFTFFYQNKGLMYFLLSGRDVFLDDAMKYIDVRYSFLDYMLGIGASYANILFKSTEMDFFDLMIWHGLFWCILIYTSFIFIFYLVFKSSSTKGFVLMFLLLAITSTFAGHVLTSAMITPLISLYYPYVLLKENEQNPINQ
ncbi:O-antigen ligase family protein [Vibrio cholerae]|uniref:O-antigen ligase family protein n=1 Tax=Vibrio cholerae TaxID=666 RepID=UPI0008420A4F|nr:O-antigen ligase family protein [Vibrio cholerae]